MIIRVLLIASLVGFSSGSAMGRPIEQGRYLPKIEQLDASGRNDRVRSDLPAVFGAATAGTTFFGGTYWAADSMRWEAFKDQLWTFDSGVGSSIVPAGGPQGLSAPTSGWVNPYKKPGWHATMEGWIGVDRTFSEIPYFRRIGSDDPRFGAVKCVGSARMLEGTYSFWCGVFPAEANDLCYAAGQGYGNAWNVCIEHSFAYGGGNATLGFKYNNDAEDGFDFTRVYCDTSEVKDFIELISFTGTVGGTANITLTPGTNLPRIPKPVTIRFCVTTDGSWSDQDGLNPTACGAFAVDNIVITGGITHTATFETGDDGWTLSTPYLGWGGEWSDLRHVNDLPATLTTCGCALEDSVLLFADDHNNHNAYQDNFAVSPWIDLKQYGMVGASGKIIKTNLYTYLPLYNYLFVQFQAQWYPETCLLTGKLTTSPWKSNDFVYFFDGIPQCTSTAPGTAGTQINFSGVISPGAEQVRISVGVISYCRFFGNCTQFSTTSPWFDDVGLGVYGLPGAPNIFTDANGRAQDNFPSNPGSVSRTAPGRIDCNDVQGDDHPAPWTTLGDTLVVHCVASNVEVYVHFKVRPGPGTGLGGFNAWYGSHAASPIDPTFKRARCDTAEVGTNGPSSGFWMTSYHEADPNFATHGASDRTIDAFDPSPKGGSWHLSHDIFPDNLFTPGSRIDYFFSANVVGSNESSLDPQTAPANTYEVEILPSSFSPQNTFNCVLYVDHFDRGGQALIEGGLLQILGSGSANVENTKWDRYDVNAPWSGQASLGRYQGADYGASGYQLLATYRVILWDTGDLEGFNLREEDGFVLNAWLTQSGVNELYLSGNSIVHDVIANASTAPSADYLIEGLAGVTLKTACASGSFSAAGCPAAGSPPDLTPCVNLVRNPGALVAGLDRPVGHVAQGNGCPERRSFDVFDVLRPDYGLNRADEVYASGVKSASYASVGTWAGIKIVTDGVSVTYRQDEGTPCDFANGGRNAVTERLAEVLRFFQVSEGVCLPYGTGVPNEDAPPALTLLSTVSPNPLMAGAIGRIRFSMAKDGAAKLEVLDLQGRLVKTVFDGPAKQGANEVTWDGRDASGAWVGSGVYFYRFRALDQDQTKKLVIVGGRN
jgi:flagellar hook capping protein FlgD